MGQGVGSVAGTKIGILLVLSFSLSLSTLRLRVGRREEEEGDGVLVATLHEGRETIEGRSHRSGVMKSEVSVCVMYM